MDTALNPNCYPHAEGCNKSLLVGDIEECEETEKLLQNKVQDNEDSEIDSKMKESILSLLKSENFVPFSYFENKIDAAVQKQVAMELAKEDSSSSGRRDIEAKHDVERSPLLLDRQESSQSSKLFLSENELSNKDALTSTQRRIAEASIVAKENIHENEELILRIIRKHLSAVEENIKEDVLSNILQNQEVSEHTDDNETEEMVHVSIEEDTFSLMMFSPYCSVIYFVGIWTFLFQSILFVMLFLFLFIDNIHTVGIFEDCCDECYCTSIHTKFTFYPDIPIRVNTYVRIGQFLVAVLSITLQSDTHVAIQYLILLRKGTESLKILQNAQQEQGQANSTFMLRAVYFPNFLRLLQGLTTTSMIMILIVKNDDFLDLLMNFTALYVISSEVDDVVFKLIRRGFCPCFHLVKASSEIERIEFQDIKKQTKLRCNSFVFRSSFMMVQIVFVFGIISWVAYLQDSGFFFDQKYPDCNVPRPEYIQDDVCDYGPYNTEDCGWDGGDCSVVYDVMMNKLGDGKCDGGDYNTEYLGWDGGDCIQFNEKYPNCNVNLPSLVGNNQCNNGEYNTEACGWDGGDCDEYNELWKLYPDCLDAYPSLIGNGQCDGEYNTEACGWDGGDCDEYNELWKLHPKCKAAPSLIGNGQCDGEYNTKACGWDSGDCTCGFICRNGRMIVIILSTVFCIFIVIFCRWRCKARR